MIIKQYITWCKKKDLQTILKSGYNMDRNVTWEQNWSGKEIKTNWFKHYNHPMTFFDYCVLID